MCHGSLLVNFFPAKTRERLRQHRRFPLRFSPSLSLSSLFASSFHVSVLISLPRFFFSSFLFLSSPPRRFLRPLSPRDARFSFQISVNRRITRRTSCSITRNRALRWLFSFEGRRERRTRLFRDFLGRRGGVSG